MLSSSKASACLPSLPSTTRSSVTSPDGPVEDAMSEGPSTVRPSIGIDALIKRMDERDLTTFPVTTPDGRLVGLVRRADAEKAVASVFPSA